MHLAKALSSLALLHLTFGAAKPCRNPPVRKEWRELNHQEKSEYLEAVHCLTTKDSISGLEGAVNRFDDFQAVHSSQTPSIHWVGHFALWHRYFVATYEKALREECGYTGAQPYWNWSKDASTDSESAAIFETEIFDSCHGFGGNGAYVEITDPAENPFNLTGRTGGGCVQDGPFTSDKFMLNHPERGCLKRDFIPWIMNTFAQQSLVDHVQSQPDYTSFARALENIPAFTEPNIHGSGHFGAGGVLGTLGNQYESPGDPLFYLHHGNIDRVLWEWQRKDLKTRLHQVGGPIEPMDYSGANVTLDFTVNIGALAGDATLEQLLNAQGDVLCYTYNTA
ncbi:tyrosinase family protein [Aspergillus lucknowensis]|uniref:Tyrosinase copper-binding domain-containing protein n=1 Tax=Aspergillus lucknowensis TaxID=176173 RepID=A0ABR4LF00_9EURO